MPYLNHWNIQSKTHVCSCISTSWVMQLIIHAIAIKIYVSVSWISNCTNTESMTFHNIVWDVITYAYPICMMFCWHTWCVPTEHHAYRVCMEINLIVVQIYFHVTLCHLFPVSVSVRPQLAMVCSWERSSPINKLMWFQKQRWIPNLLCSSKIELSNM